MRKFLSTILIIITLLLLSSSVFAHTIINDAMEKVKDVYAQAGLVALDKDKNNAQEAVDAAKNAYNEALRYNDLNNILDKNPTPEEIEAITKEQNTISHTDLQAEESNLKTANQNLTNATNDYNNAYTRYIQAQADSETDQAKKDALTSEINKIEADAAKAALDECQVISSQDSCEGVKNDFDAANEALNDYQREYQKKYSLKEKTFDVTKNLKLDTNEQPTEYFKSTTDTPLFALILSVLNFATRIIGTLAVILIIAAGFVLMAAGGNETQLDKGKEMIKFAIIGLVITFMSYIIILFVQSIFTN